MNPLTTSPNRRQLLQGALAASVLGLAAPRVRAQAATKMRIGYWPVAAGLPGVGKSHIAAALGYELILQGHPVLWTPTSNLVQRLLAAKRDLRLPQELARLDKFACVILDDIGYVQQDRDEMEVLFTFLSERYESKSVIITTNLVFSEWNYIFKNPMTTMAAIDRVVHHSVILDLMEVESYRATEANNHRKLQQEAAQIAVQKPAEIVAIGGPK